MRLWRTATWRLVGGVVLVWAASACAEHPAAWSAPDLPTAQNSGSAAPKPSPTTTVEATVTATAKPTARVSTPPAKVKATPTARANSQPVVTSIRTAPAIAVCGQATGPEVDAMVQDLDDPLDTVVVRLQYNGGGTYAGDVIMTYDRSRNLFAFTLPTVTAAKLGATQRVIMLHVTARGTMSAAEPLTPPVAGYVAVAGDCG